MDAARLGFDCASRHEQRKARVPIVKFGVKFAMSLVEPKDTSCMRLLATPNGNPLP